jgi:hypothetical protein
MYEKKKKLKMKVYQDWLKYVKKGWDFFFFLYIYFKFKVR